MFYHHYPKEDLMTRHLKLFLLGLLFLCFGSSLPAKADIFDLLIPIEEYCLGSLDNWGIPRCFRRVHVGRSDGLF